MELNPAFLSAYLKFQDGPARSGHLEPKVREFMYIAIDGAVSHLYERGLRRHIADALRLGATKEEVLQVIMLATATQGQLPNEIGHAILMEELGEGAPALTEAEQRRKDAYVRTTGAWPQGRRRSRLAPEFAEGFLGYGEISWEAGAASRRRSRRSSGWPFARRHHCYTSPASAGYICLALDHGATRHEISRRYQLASAIAIHTCTYAVPGLTEADKGVGEGIAPGARPSYALPRLRLAERALLA